MEKSKIDDIFNIWEPESDKVEVSKPVSQEDADGSDDYALKASDDMGSNKAKFSDKVEDISVKIMEVVKDVSAVKVESKGKVDLNTIFDSKDNKIEPENIIKEVKEVKVPEVVKIVKEPKPEPKPEIEIEIEDTDSEDKVEEVKAEAAKDIEEPEVKKDKINKYIEVKHGVEFINGVLQWQLKCNNERFERFYREKQEIISQVVPVEQIPYKSWVKELSSSSVQLDNNQLYDLKYLNEKMQEVQKYLDRITQIYVICNDQFFAWQQLIPMFEGLLAGFLYEKPAIRQEGIIYEHMRDMRIYWGQLSSIRDSTDVVLKNLEKARETISRHVTIVLSNLEPNRVVKVDQTSQQRLQKIRPEPPNVKKVSPDLSGFDTIEEGSAMEPASKGTREVTNWSSVGQR